MPGQRKIKRQRQEEMRQDAARFTPELGRWEVLFETQDVPDWLAYCRRLRASDTVIDGSAVRMDMVCGPRGQPALHRLSLFVPHPVPEPRERPSGS